MSDGNIGIIQNPNKSKLTDSPILTKVKGLNKEQKALLEKAIDKLIINNKMCSKNFTPTAKNSDYAKDENDRKYLRTD
jgi:hypothetical protein